MKSSLSPISLRAASACLSRLNSALGFAAVRSITPFRINSSRQRVTPTIWIPAGTCHSIGGDCLEARTASLNASRASRWRSDKRRLTIRVASAAESTGTITQDEIASPSASVPISIGPRRLAITSPSAPSFIHSTLTITFSSASLLTASCASAAPVRDVRPRQMRVYKEGSRPPKSVDLSYLRFVLGRCAIAYGPDRMIETWGAEFGGEYRGRLEDKIGEGARLMATLVRVATAFRPLVGRRFPCVR